MTTGKYAYALVVLGHSGSGKDTFSKCVNGEAMKFSRPVKNHIEETYGLPKGSLDYEEFKDKLVVDCYGVTQKYTYRDILIDAYETVSSKYPTQYFNVLRRLYWNSKSDLFVFNDCRTVAESEFIHYLSDKEVTCVIIEREGKKALAADRNLAIVSESFSTKVYVKNDGTEAQLISAGVYIARLIRQGKKPCKSYSTSQMKFSVVC